MQAVEDKKSTRERNEIYGTEGKWGRPNARGNIHAAARRGLKEEKAIIKDRFYLSLSTRFLKETVGWAGSGIAQISKRNKPQRGRFYFGSVEKGKFAHTALKSCVQ